MRRTAITLLSLSILACKGAPPAATETGAEAKPEAEARAREPFEPKPPKQARIVRKDLVAEELPPAPELDAISPKLLAEGEFAYPEGSDELAPRAALALPGGLLLAGQGYEDRKPGQPPQTWRWTGFVASSPADNRSELHELGAIRAGIVHDGRALLTGTRGTGFDVRGWFGIVGPDGALVSEVALDSPNTTELFDLVPGRGEGELTVVGGYVDAQGWLVSLGADGRQRWQKYVRPVEGYLQIRALARLDDDRLLAVGAVAKSFGAPWIGLAPGDGGESAAGDDVVQTTPEIAGADPNMMIRAIVDLGEAGLVALATAKRNHIQAHDQVVALGFDRSGEPSWSTVVAELRVVEVLGARADGGVARFVVTVPAAGGSALAISSLEPGEGGEGVEVVARRLADSDNWTSAGFVEGAAGPELVAYANGDEGIAWRRFALSTEESKHD